MQTITHALRAAVVTLAISANVTLAQNNPPAAVPAQTNDAPAPPPPPRANTAIIPNLSRGFMAAHNRNVEVAKKGDIDLLFTGDSITDWWRSPGRGTPIGDAIPFGGKTVFDKYFGTNKTANFGIAGDTTQGLLWRLQNGEGQGFQPKAVMVMIGTNNDGRNTPTEVAMGVADIIFELRKDFPNAKILLLGIFPRSTPGSRLRTANDEVNKIIPALNDNQHVFYMDIGWKFLAANGTIPHDVMSDTPPLHPTSKGYEIWANAVHDTLIGWLQ